jgi:hypothetical protein
MNYECLNRYCELNIKTQPKSSFHVEYITALVVFGEGIANGGWSTMTFTCVSK